MRFPNNWWLEVGNGAVCTMTATPPDSWHETPLGLSAPRARGSRTYYAMDSWWPYLLFSSDRHVNLGYTMYRGDMHDGYAGPRGMP